MTIQECHIAIDLELDKTLDFEFPYIQSEEKDYWLNKAQDRIIKQKLFGNNVKKLPYDFSIERIDDLKPLVKNSDLTASAYNVGLSTYINQFTLPDDYKFYLKSFVLVDKIMRSGYSVIQSPFPVEIIEREKLQRYMTIPGVNKPDLDILKGIIEENLLIVVFDSYSTNITTCKLTYIKEPIAFDYNANTISDLPDHVIKEIIDITVLLLLANFESDNRVKIESELNTTNE